MQQLHLWFPDFSKEARMNREAELSPMLLAGGGSDDSLWFEYRMEQMECTMHFPLLEISAEESEAAGMDPFAAIAGTDSSR